MTPQRDAELPLPAVRDPMAAPRIASPRNFAKEIVAKAVRAPGVYAVSGVAGAGAAHLCVELLSAGAPGVLLVCAEHEEAFRAHSDLRFLVQRAGRGQERPLPEPRLLLAEEADPYSELPTDRRTSLSRLGTLARLARQEAPLVVSNASALVRKLLPPEVVRQVTCAVELNADLDLPTFRTTLAETGYLAVPVVEDPGSFAVRGGLVDVWPADARWPVRIELFGDAVLSMQTFDPDSQRSSGAVQRLLLPPARDAILTPVYRERAAQRLRELCDSHNYPSAKTRQLIEDVTLARPVFGAAAYLPALYELGSIWDYLDPGWVLVFEQPALSVERLRREVERFESVSEATPEAPDRPRFVWTELCLDLEQFERHASQKPLIGAAVSLVMGGASSSVLQQLESPAELSATFGQSDHRDLELATKQARAASGKHAGLDPLLERVRAWCEQGFEVEAVARGNTQATRLAALLRHRDVQVLGDWRDSELDGSGFIDSGLSEDPLGSALVSELGDQASLWSVGDTAPASDTLRVRITTGTLERGFAAPFERLVLLAEEEIFGRRAHTAPSRSRKKHAVLEDLRALVPGDYVVHTEHGVGRYLGLENRTLPGGGQVELLSVEYTGGKLYLPVYRLNQIEKLTTGDKPKLDRLGGQSFAKTKARAKAKAREMADDLLRLYAERRAVEKDPLPPPDDDYATFEASFPYDETSDQAAAIAETLRDLEQKSVMDRLVCGDVGFGKTEVALRAAFRVASYGRQVAILCPTTVLAQQHFLTFSNRLRDYPIEVRVMSRFQTAAAMTDTLKRLREGTVDVVIGTHRLLSKDLQFKQLGLVVVDEEQRFGVVHKERLKKMCAAVDVLTLTATPIPRTLQLALGGLREMSIIATAPVERRAIRTVMARFDETILKEAVTRELSRGGQVYYVYNRVEGLAERAARLQALMPQARIGVAHGQMREALLERTMLSFVAGDLDVLVSTAIVESGLDIPRANTMIIDRADLFGLSELYQLRGRVGRSAVRAYCYLMVPAPAEMSDPARTRVEALERYSELGSGFHVAMLDMEQRGAGDLLGAEQSGVIQSVGLELFCRMLDEATHELRGEPVVHDVEPELSLDVEALLPQDYIDEVGVRLSLYKRLASAMDESEVLALASEMEDRFGPAPPEAQRLVELMRLKTELRRLRVLVCEASGARVSLRFRDDTPLDPGRLAELVSQPKSPYRLSPEGRLTRHARPDEVRIGSLELAGRMLEEISERL